MKIAGFLIGTLLAGQAFPLGGAEPANKFYPVNRPPLAQTKFVALPLGAIKPQGWLKDQLTVQARGLTGHLDEFWPDLKNSAWKGKDGDAWERGPYYLDGLLPLAYLLDDDQLAGIAGPYIQWLLASSQPNGWFGPAKNHDRWPLAVAMKVLTQYYEATSDPRALTVLKNYFVYLKNAPPDWPDKEWRGVRAMENVVTAYWLYRRTGDPELLKVADSIYRNSFDWTSYFLKFPYTEDVINRGVKHGHPTHVVNIAMAIKHPGVFFQQARDERLRQAVFAGIQSLDLNHGQVGGRFSGDEHLAGRRPTQGTELCGVVEYMFSLENLIEVLGEPTLADRLEMLAYNGNPGATTADYWAHQYDQQANQVLCTVAKRKWSTNGDDSNLYGLEPNFGCCTANMHQGWPKFVSHLWMATHDQGLAAVAYGPCQVTARVFDGTTVTIKEVTEYPFDGVIKFKVEIPDPTPFPLYFRIPAWAAGTVVKLNGKPEPVKAQPGSFVCLQHNWKSGDIVTLDMPMRIRAEKRHNGAVAIYRGPLVFSLKLFENFRALKSHAGKLPAIDWQITPDLEWNYGLIVDPEKPENYFEVIKRDIASVPFEHNQAPVILVAKGRIIPEWKLVDNSAGETPLSPVVSSQPVTRLELIPYGSTRLRITEFPVLSTSEVTPLDGPIRK